MNKKQAIELTTEIESFIIDGMRLKQRFKECINPVDREALQAELGKIREQLADALVEATRDGV